MENEHITVDGVEVTGYPDLTEKYQVMGVPKTVVNETLEYVGARPESYVLGVVKQAGMPPAVDVAEPAAPEPVPAAVTAEPAPAAAEAEPTGLDLVPESPITFDAIAARAHAIWEANGRRDGRAEADWEQAERELRNEARRRLPPDPPSPS